MAETTGTPMDVAAVNPRYQGTHMSDVARVLLRPVSPKARAVLAQLQDGTQPENVTHPVKSAL